MIKLQCKSILIISTFIHKSVLCYSTCIMASYHAHNMPHVKCQYKCISDQIFFQNVGTSLVHKTYAYRIFLFLIECYSNKALP